jgi:hypothetical protein
MPVCKARQVRVDDAALGLRRASLAKKVSTAFGQEHDLGVKMKGPAGIAGEPVPQLGPLMGAVVVEHDVATAAARPRG